MNDFLDGFNEDPVIVDAANLLVQWAREQEVLRIIVRNETPNENLLYSNPEGLSKL